MSDAFPRAREAQRLNEADRDPAPWRRVLKGREGTFGGDAIVCILINICIPRYLKLSELVDDTLKTCIFPQCKPYLQAEQELDVNTEVVANTHAGAYGGAVHGCLSLL